PREIQATEGGVLSGIHVPVGAVAPVGAVVAIIGDGSDRPAAKPPAAAAPAQALGKAAPPLAAPSKANAPIKLDPYFEVRTPAKNYGPSRTASGAPVTPLARRIAAEAGIDLAKIKGSGPRNRIVAAAVAG